jgi:Leucine-rich repeat (LRR) protein
MDASLTLLPAAQQINLSNNNITTLQNLTACTSLAELDLSNNNIASLAQVGLCPGPLRRLILRVRASVIVV